MEVGESKPQGPGALGKQRGSKWMGAEALRESLPPGSYASVFAVTFVRLADEHPARCGCDSKLALAHILAARGGLFVSAKSSAQDKCQQAKRFGTRSDQNKTRDRR